MKIMKTILLLFTLVFALASCGGSKGDTQKSKEIDYTKIDEIELTCDEYPEYFAVLSDEQMEYVTSLWQEGRWEPHVKLKLRHPYRFKIGEFVISCTLGFESFYDETNDRSLRLSDEQGDILKSYFQAVSAEAIAQITVGMTMSQVLDILGSSGTNVGSGEIIIRYACDNGDEYNIVYMYDYDIDSLVVWNIVKN